MSQKKRIPLPLLGWREWLALPDLGLGRIKAKVDTGARTSALHAVDLKSFERDGDPWIRFTVHPLQRRGGSVRVAAPVIDRRKVRPSTGEAKVRPVIRVRVGIGGSLFPIEMTLVRREMMGFRMLLGRQAIRGRYRVDPGESYLAGAAPIGEVP